MAGSGTQDGHDAFMSYSHAADGVVAPAVERGLERLARPWNRLRAMSVFRDHSDLSLTPHLWETIEQHLDHSRYFILLACPEAASSHWVNREIARWCDTKGTESLMLIWTGGELQWDEAIGDFRADSTAVPPALHGRFSGEPLYLDLRWARTTPELSLQLGAFRSAIAQVAGPIRNVPPDQLEGEDIRQHRRARRLARAAVFGLVALALVATVAGVVAVANAKLAERRTRDATARQIGLAAIDAPAVQLDQALLMALASASLTDSNHTDRFDPALVLIGRYSRLRKVLQVGEQSAVWRLTSLAMSADGSTVSALGVGDQGVMQFVRWNDEPEPAISVVPEGIPDDVAALVASGASPSVHRGQVVMLNRWVDRGWFFFEGSLQLRNLEDGEVLAQTSGDETSIVDIGPERTVVVTGAQLSVFDSVSGQPIATTDAGAAVLAAVGPDAATPAIQITSNQELVVWRLADARLTPDRALTLPAGLGSPKWIAIGERGRNVLVVGSTGSAMVSIESTSINDTVTPGTGPTAIELDPSRRFVAVGGSRLNVWDLQLGRRVVAIPQPTNALSWSGPCNSTVPCKLAVAGVSIDVIDPVAETQVRIADQVSAVAIAISGDGTQLASNGWGGTVAVWEATPSVDNSAREVLPRAAETVAADPRCRSGLSAVSPQETFVVGVDPQTQVLVRCRIGAGQSPKVSKLGDSLGIISSVAIDDQGAVAIGRDSGFAEYFGVQDGALQPGKAIDARAGGEAAPVVAVAVRSGVVVAGLTAPSKEGENPARVLVWTVGAGQPITFQTDFSDVAGLALSNDQAATVVVANRNGSGEAIIFQAWDTQTRRRIGRAFDGLRGDVVSLKNEDGAVEATDSNGNSFRWVLDRDPTRDICTMVGRSLRLDEWQEYADGALARYPFKDPCPQ